MDRTLELKFKLSNDKTLTLSIPNPKTGLSDESVKQAMELIVTNNIFSRDGATIVAIDSARIIERRVTTYAVA